MENFTKLQDKYKKSGVDAFLINRLAIFYGVSDKYIFDTFLSLDVFNFFNSIYAIKDAQDKGLLDYDVSETMSYYKLLDEKIIGSSKFKTMLDLMRLFNLEEDVPPEDKINPVYYFSAICDFEKYKQRDKKKIIAFVKDKDLKEFSTYQRQLDYDSVHFHTENGIPHSTIKLINFSLVNYAYSYFENKKVDTYYLSSLRKDYESKMASLASRALYKPTKYGNGTFANIAYEISKHYVVSNGDEDYFAYYFGTYTLASQVLNYSIEPIYLGKRLSYITRELEENSFYELENDDISYNLILGYYGACRVLNDFSGIKSYPDTPWDVQDMYYDFRTAPLVTKYISMYHTGVVKSLDMKKIRNKLSQPVKDIGISQKDIHLNYFKDIKG